MAPREGTRLLVNSSGTSDGSSKHFDIRQASFGASDPGRAARKKLLLIVGAVLLFAGGVVLSCLVWTKLETASTSTTTSPSTGTTAAHSRPTGPYELVECQEGSSFFDAYEFFDGADSLGSAGYNIYVSRQRAEQVDILNVTSTTDNANDQHQDSFVYMSSAPTSKGPREAIRLEGKRRYNRGLFLLDLHHMPAGPGVWPAFWLTDEDNWPDNGEIDILEGINNQTRAKTALHTSSMCSMYAQVSNWEKTGYWDRATGIPDTYTGELNFETNKEADDCWNLAAHQWFNQGCVGIDDQDGSIGAPLNANGGGVFALEWDPTGGYIRSWAFPRDHVPANAQEAMDTASISASGRTEETTTSAVAPDPSTWGLPYAYFAIGGSSSCSADHFQNMHIVFNLAFCGNVAGNRFFKDCEEEAKHFNVSNDPILSCNAFIQSNPKVLEEAYWKIRGVYVYERSMERVVKHDVNATTKTSGGTD